MIRFFSPQNRVVTLKLIRYSMVMLLAPLATFYFSFYVFFQQDRDMIGWSGLLAVLAANVVIASYVMMAIKEDRADKAARRNQQPIRRNRTD